MVKVGPAPPCGPGTKGSLWAGPLRDRLASVRVTQGRGKPGSCPAPLDYSVSTCLLPLPHSVQPCGEIGQGWSLRRVGGEKGHPFLLAREQRSWSRGRRRFAPISVGSA